MFLFYLKIVATIVLILTGLVTLSHGIWSNVTGLASFSLLLSGVSTVILAIIVGYTSYQNLKDSEDEYIE